MDSVIITGASRGIGAATALRCAQHGFAVCVNYRNGEAAAQRVVTAVTAAGGQAVAVQADVANESDVIRLFDTCERSLARPVALVNNAGILEQQMRLEDMTLGRFERVFSTNVIGTLLCSREAVRRMSTRLGGRGGVIVNVSSLASRFGAPDEYVDYAASKGAIDSLTLGLAKEVGRDGIRVNAVRPGLIYTDMHASGGEPGRVDRLGSALPLRRGGTAEEVAETIVWLLSPEASYASGTFIDVAGGR